LPRRNVFFDSGYAPGSGCAPARNDPVKLSEPKLQVKDGTRGTARNESARYGEAQPSPHIGRQSRNTSGNNLVEALLRRSAVMFPTSSR